MDLFGFPFKHINLKTPFSKIIRKCNVNMEYL